MGVESFFRREPLGRGGELSVERLIELALGPEHKNGGRLIRMVKEVGSLRLVPKALVESAQKHLEKTEDIEAVINYVRAGFFFYRQCVNEDFFAPHVLVEGAYEWPEPTLFSWDNIDGVIWFGSLAEGTSVKGATIKVEEAGMVITTDVSTGEKTAREIRAIPDKMKSEIKFRTDTPSLNDIGFLPSQNWQITSLRAYSNPLYWISEDLKNGSLESDLARQYLEECLVNLAQPIENVAFGRYCRKGEKQNFLPL